MKRMFNLFPLVLSFIISSTTFAAPPASIPSTLINAVAGTYATVSTRSCVQTVAGGDFGGAPQYQLLSDGTTRVYQLAGVLTLFGPGPDPKYGQGSWSGKNLAIIDYQSLSLRYPVYGWTGDCDVSYSANPDGTLRFEFVNCEGLSTAGYYTGWPSGQNDFVESASVSVDWNTLLLSIVDPRLEISWIQDPSTSVRYEYKRICSRTGIAVKLKK
jgi:hypothetical protein